MAVYPTGVEVHGESLRIWFIYQGKRVRENLAFLTRQKTGKWQENFGLQSALR